MNETILSPNLAGLITSYLYYLLLTCHVCLFIELSPIIKRPVSRLSYFLASTVSAAVPFIVTTTMTFSTELLRNSVGTLTAVAASFGTLLIIQKFINID
jgi:hypothetical protein